MGDSDILFSCSTDSPKFFAQALNAIAWRSPENQSCSVSISAPGILFVCEDSAILQASVFLKATLFRSYDFPGQEPYNFRVNLTSVVQALKLFAETATSLDLSVDSASDLRIKISDQGSVTDCTIRTLHCPPELVNQLALTDAFSSRDSLEIVSFVISSVVAREMFRFPNERKNKAVSIEMTIDPIARTFAVKAEGAYGLVRSVIAFSNLDFHHVKLDIEQPFAAVYPVWSLTPVLDAMAASFETKFKFKGNGLLAVQQGIKGSHGSGIETIVEFILQPLEEDGGL
jgi:cell cycle checkpoint protein